MNKHQCILCLGSNWMAEKNIEFATNRLTKLFPDIQLSKPVHTAPIGMPNDFMFVNSAGRFTTDKGMDEIKSIFKSIEKECGRNPEDKKRGIIHLDIDLLKIDDTVLKADDLERDFVIDGLSSL